MKNIITKISSKLNQSDNSDRALRDEKAQPCRKSLANAIVTMVFRKYDVTLMILLELAWRHLYVSEAERNLTLEVVISVTALLRQTTKHNTISNEFIYVASVKLIAKRI